VSLVEDGFAMAATAEMRVKLRFFLDSNVANVAVLEASNFSREAGLVTTARQVLAIMLYEGASFSPDRLHNRPEAARYLLTLVTARSDRDTHTLSKFS
jgi:hypothetical protein